VRLPLELARLADLEKECVLLGVRDHMEIWNRCRWEAYLGDRQMRYDEIAERAFTRQTEPTADRTTPSTSQPKKAPR
jgi:DNA-binding transcriptional regulator/RsmH inhibitor MraZ